MLNLIERAKGLWPKATDIEIGLLTKIFKDIPEDTAISIIEDARLASRFNSPPFPDIKKRASKIKINNLNGSYIDCWAVHKDTKKFKECAVLATDNYGAGVMMQKYLRHRCNVEPTDYVLFVGKDSFRAFFNFRMGIEEPVEEDTF